MNGTAKLYIAMSDTTPGRAQLLLFESLDLIASTTIGGLLWGIAFTLYIFCVLSLYPQLKKPHQRRQAQLTLVYSSVVMICGIMFLATTTWITQQAYIYHNDFSAGPIEYETLYLRVQPIGILGIIFSVALDFLTLAIQIWRLWVIWNTTSHVVAVTTLPLLLFLGFIAVDITAFIHTGRSVPIFATVLILQLAITVLVTLLIILRLMLVRRRHIKLMGESDISRQYLGIIAMLVESYALETVWCFAGLVSYFVRNGPVSTFFLDCVVGIKVIAYLLVICRVAVGQAWNEQTERQISTLHYAIAAETSTWNSQALRDVNTLANSSLQSTQSTT
ncbi:hypothetical protein P691DRAFT_778320 [Macrolepiota fuliginosa MF-IS2]|uniref:Uncharacterized protein n=1 Tax=Macrolepiota fuliginosa MF-IS2 TaxID=1400762 RepID=A0A9P6BYK6_9AGAR|nr:hypothetical protein P691DRAFT_778320 [Macrolepiota fuliginosa MF-IS2]